MDTINTNSPEDKIIFTPRHAVHKNRNGQTGLDETFYLNDDLPQMADCNIFHCFAFGVSYWGGDWSIYKEFNRYISFNFILEGSTFLQTDHETFHAKAGDIMLGRRTPMTMRTAPGGMAKKYCLLLSNNMIQSVFCDMLVHHDPAILTMNDPEKTARQLEKIHDLVKNGSSRRELDTAIFHFLQDVLDQYHRQHKPQTLLDKALNILLKTNFKLSRAELAHECNVDPRTLTRVFTRQLNIPPGQYIISKRLERAARMLTTTTEPVKHIADECGFSSPMFFAREFRQHYHYSPSDFRKLGKTPEK